MCGISGMIGLAYDQELTKRMLESMRRRGPDQNGIFHDKECCLLHSRLTVIDPDGGKQPMTLAAAGEIFTIVYNGELYNTDEIRNGLKKLGHFFEGHSDTEVVLHAYAQWGEECLQLFNGIFAFAIWESKRQRLFLARDRMGVKPLFYALHKNGLLFASEIKTILCYPTMEAKVDASGVGQLLLLGPGRTGGSGILPQAECPLHTLCKDKRPNRTRSFSRSECNTDPADRSSPKWLPLILSAYFTPVPKIS